MTRLFLALALSPALLAQEPELSKEEHRIRITPATLTLEVGQTAELDAEVVDTGGRPVAARVFFYSRSRRSVSVTREGLVTAHKPGSFEVIARSAQRGGPRATIPVTVPHPTPAKIDFVDAIQTIHVGTTRQLDVVVRDQNGFELQGLTPTITSADPGIAAIDSFGQLTGVAAGECAILARAADLASVLSLRVLENPVHTIELSLSAESVRTGDVVRFTATCKDSSGAEVTDVPVFYSFFAQQDDDLGPGASGQIEQDGRFVAETPGRYTIVASCGEAVTRRTLRAEPRGVTKRLVKVGHGEVFDSHTSDLWVWEGVDGRDYAVTGTWGANGDAHFWDVTEPAKIKRIATVTIDARTVNDVKVSEDGRICVLSREGATNRRNGIVILNVEDPSDPVKLAAFDDQLTGGVHNLYIANNHVYALSAGRRYDVINIEDPEVPVRVGSYELGTAGHSIHDVWVNDGIAYSSNWRDGIHIVDVGNGVKGGSPENPVPVANYAYPSGWNHAAFPYKSEEAGRFYVIAGDEAFPFGLSTENKPTYARGWFHFIDFTDPENPDEVAPYQVPEPGTHNLWVEGDVMYGAYYNGGLRVVDISGELMGDLYRQGREIAWFIPTHPESYVPNAAMTWGPQPHKGHIFFSDWNSGLWAVKLVDARRR